MISSLAAQLCHRIPERMLLIGGEPTLFCSRCMGLYIGVACLAFLWIAALRHDSEFAPSRGTRLLAGTMVLAMALDVLSSHEGWRQTTNSIRFLTGLAAGNGLMLLAAPGLSRLYPLWKRRRSGPAFREVHLWAYALLSCLFGGLVLRGLLPLTLLDSFAVLGCTIYLLLACAGPPLVILWKFRNWPVDRWLSQRAGDNGLP